MKRANIYFDNTLGQFNKLKEQIKVANFAISIIVQLFFITLYSYRIYTCTRDTVRLAIYSTLLGIVVTLLALEVIGWIITDKELKATHRKRKLAVKCTKFSVCIGSLCYTVYEALTVGISDLSKTLAIFAAMFLVISMLVEAVKQLTTYYVDNITLAVKMDIEGNIVGEYCDRMGYARETPTEAEYVARGKVMKDTEKYAPPHKEPANGKTALGVAASIAKDVAKDALVDAMLKKNKKNNTVVQIEDNNDINN